MKKAIAYAELKSASHDVISSLQTVAPQLNDRAYVRVTEIEGGETIKFKGRYFLLVSNKSVGDYQMLELLRRGR